MWPPPLSLRCSALLIPTYKVWSRVLRVETHTFGSPHSELCSLRHLRMSSHCVLGHAMPYLYTTLSTLGTWAMPSQTWIILSWENHIAMLVISQGAEETWISCHTAGRGPVPLETLALDWLAQGQGSFSSTSGATDPACVTFYMVLLRAIRWCLHIYPPTSGIWSVSLAETRAELLTHTAALSTQSTTSQLPTTSSCSENTWSWRISKYFLPLPEREALLFLG